MGELTVGVSWIAVVVGTILSFLLGWLWYSPKLFGNKWAECLGVKMDAAHKMPVGAMTTQILGLFLMSWFVAVTAASNLLLTAILATLAFTVLGWSGGMFSQKPAYARYVDAGYWIASLAVMIACNAIF